VSARRSVSFEEAVGWIDGATDGLGSEEIALDLAAGRVSIADLCAYDAIPEADCAAIDGFAVTAEASLGAGAYNPLIVDACALEAGEPMPPGMDAVVPLGHAEPDGAGRILMVEPIVAGGNIDRRGAVAAAGTVLVKAGTRLTPHHLGLLAVSGLTRLPVARRPQVRLAIAGRARSGKPVNSNGPMLRALIERDGGVAIEADMAQAFDAGADLVVIAGGTGNGVSDRSASVLAEAGILEIHGVALIPGETAGFGHTATGAIVVMLPGTPASCLWNYELFAGRAIRRLGGRAADLPYRSRRVTTARKIVSPIGMTEICAIRHRPDGAIEPAASFAESGLMAAVAADGFVITPAKSEGYPAGAAVDAYFY